MNGKRAFDIAIGVFATVLSAPFVGIAALAIYLTDFHSPLYIASRIGKRGQPFRMYKLRSMIPNADRSGVDSTASDDARLIAVGRWVRRLKLDELPQFWNVLAGDMSIVGPRPNVKRETDLYTQDERELLAVSPGVTDLSSIVFADYSQILRGASEPDIAYNQFIRPWKSRLGLLYVRHPPSIGIDLHIVVLTALTLVSRPAALRGVRSLVARLGADDTLTAVASRTVPLRRAPPPGATDIVRSRIVHSVK